MSMSIGVSTARLASVETLPIPSPNRLLTPPSSVPLVALTRRVFRSAISATAAKTPASETRKPRGITKPKRVSSEMQAFLGVEEIPRTTALKEIWAYIKQHDLQDPQNKKIIICDEKLKTIFANKERVGFLEVAGLLSPHFL